MRCRLACLALIAAASAAPSLGAAADAPGRGGERPVYREGVVRLTTPGRRIPVDRLASGPSVYQTAEGDVLARSYVDPGTPRRIERRVYVEEGVRKPFALYGGFYGIDRWGYSREGW